MTRIDDASYLVKNLTLAGSKVNFVLDQAHNANNQAQHYQKQVGKLEARSCIDVGYYRASDDSNQQARRGLSNEPYIVKEVVVHIGSKEVHEEELPEPDCVEAGVPHFQVRLVDTLFNHLLHNGI